MHDTHEVRLFTNMRYDTVDEACRLHLFLPCDGGAARPSLVVMVHGGGWWLGSLDQYLPHCLRLAGMGFAAATVEYRFITTVGLDEMICDVARACAYLRRLSDQKGFDGDRMCLMGSSAGAHLALVVGARADELTRSGSCSDLPAVAGIVAQCPVVDVEDHLARTGNRHKLAVENLADISPARIAPERFPPVQVQHGDADEIVPLSIVESFVDGLKAAGRDEELVALADTPHGFGYNLAQDKAQEGWRHATEFFRARLRS